MACDGGAMGRKKANQTTGIFWRVVISMVGVALIILAVGRLAIYLAGEETRIYDVQTRRIGGSDGNQKPDVRYQWDILYSFTDRDGAVHTGFAKRRGGDMGVKVEKMVYYLPAAPFLHVLEKEGKPNLGQAVMLVLGGLLLYVMNRNGTRRKKAA